jgi:peptide/nickel transport system permease protein|tara:strand:- start:304 stop:1221 length:918 start_codon:yes stop_codon:yes gene_type:complete
LAKFFVRRISFAALVLLLISVFVFSLSRASGDPRNVYLDEYATDEMYEAWGVKLGLDKPLYVQYLTWLGDVMVGDFGESLYHKRNPFDLIKERLPATVSLAAIAFCWAILVGIPLGVLSAVKRGSFADYFARGFALLGQAMPVFWVALMAILIFAVELGWLPTSRKGGLDSYVMPALCLGWLPAAALLRITRGSMLEILDGEFIKLARAKGVAPTAVIWKHAFRNALIAPVTLAAIIIASFLTGTVVIESVFAWPGLGGLSIDAIRNNDFPMMAAIILMFGVFYLTANMLVDLLYMALDPRVRVE